MLRFFHRTHTSSYCTGSVGVDIAREIQNDLMTPETLAWTLYSVFCMLYRRACKTENYLLFKEYNILLIIHERQVFNSPTMRTDSVQCNRVFNKNESIETKGSVGDFLNLLNKEHYFHFELNFIRNDSGLQTSGTLWSGDQLFLPRCANSRNGMALQQCSDVSNGDTRASYNGFNLFDS